MSTVLELLKHQKISGIKIGAQDCSSNEIVPHTVDIAAYMIKDIGCEYVIIGHSERRTMHQENDDILKRKVDNALKCNLKIIFCIGENQHIRANHLVESHIISQLEWLPDSDDIMIAYEPIWAIGSGVTISPKDLAQILMTIKDYRKDASILYGGSINATNAKDFLALDNLSGLLIGGASLDYKQFNQITAF